MRLYRLRSTKKQSDMKKQSLLLMLSAMLGLVPLGSQAQRLQQPLGRGVVAVKNGNKAFISWRKLAQEPEDVQYNVYVNGAKINTEPLSASHFQTSAGDLPAGSQVTVTLVDKGVESAQSNPHTVGNYDLRNMFMSIRFDASPLKASGFSTDYVWPVDLDGDGEMDYVLNRKSLTTGLDNYVEAYSSSGKHLWTVKLGPNELSCAGQDDMILAYDVDCDGKGDVVMQTSDGTQFWEPEKQDFGLYVNGHTTGDTDGDGIIDYETQSKRNAPRYMTVVDGLTGREKSSVEQTYNEAYNRGNRSSLMGDEYNKHVGHMGVFYPDGIHPAVVMEWHTRYSNGSHTYYNSVFSYDFSGGKAGQWNEIFCKPTGGPAFHQIRIADVDADGKDEMQTGGYTMDHNGETLNNPGIAHGDRFRTSDIDPERPGLETFAIQQNAGDMLGQVLYDAATGEAIKKWYMSAVGDVGRGECMDVDPNHLGWEMWSTMGGVYNAKGDLIPDYEAPFPTEGLWWDGELDREIVQSSDSHYNVYIQDFFKGRLLEIAKLSGYRYVTVYAKRAAFWGDIIGDWREEMVLLHKENGVCVGIVGFTTDYATDVNNIYCLLQDPAYRGQCTTKGYYQSPNTGFYLGYGMPRPQLPPCMVTDLVWNSTDKFTNYERSASATYADGKTVLLDLTSDAAISVSSEMKPGCLYAMPVKGQTITLSGSGKLAGDMDLWKSQAGTLVAELPLAYTGKTIVSEGTLVVNGTLSGTLDLRARGTLAGNATLDGPCLFEDALNYEGCRFSPGTDQAPFGVITFNQSLAINKHVYLQLDLRTAGQIQSDCIKVNGDLELGGTPVLDIRLAEEKATPGEYPLVQWTGELKGDLSAVRVRGMQGHLYELVARDNQLVLVVKEQRAPAKGVLWTGAQSNVWDFETENFLLDGQPTSFVAGDEVIFTDQAVTTTIRLDDNFEVSGLSFLNETSTYEITGNGGFVGTGGLVKKGAGRLTIKTNKNGYTGATSLTGGEVNITSLADVGGLSSLGASSSMTLSDVALTIDSEGVSTNRTIQLTDTVVVEVLRGSANLKAAISGDGTLVKSGGGQLTLTSDANVYTGGTILRGGTLAQGTWTSTIGKLGSSIQVEGNSTIQIFDIDKTSQVPNFNYRVILVGKPVVTLLAGSRCVINGSFSGEGTVNLNVPYVRADMLADWSGFKGTLNVSGRDFRLGKAIDFSGTTINLTGEVTMGHFSQGSSSALSVTSKLGSLSSSTSTVVLKNGTYEVGYNNSNVTFSGNLSCETVRKYGTGTWTLTGTGSAALDIHEGWVLANNSSGQAVATATIYAGGTLSGGGFVRKVILKKGGVLTAGKASYSTGTLTVNTSLTSEEGGATITTKINKSGNDLIKIVGLTTFNGDTLNVRIVNRTLVAGEEFKLLDANNRTIQGSLIVSPATPGEGLTWDTSRLYTEGILRVADASGIHATGKGALLVYPQLVSDYCTINASQACVGMLDWQLTDLGGRVMQEGTFDASVPQQVDVTAYPLGIYFLRLSQQGETKVTRIVKVK